MITDALVLVSPLVVLALIGFGIHKARRAEQAFPRMRPGQTIPHLYKWSRHHTQFVEWQIAYADRHPRDIDGINYMMAPVHPDCYFKINHELKGTVSDRDDGLELLIEAKMVLTKDCLDGEEFYVLRIRPLRGTDFWPVLIKFIERLGPPDAMCVARDFAGGDLPRAYSTQDVEMTWNCWGRPVPMPNSKAEQEA